MMDKEEVGSSSKGTMDRENIAGIILKPKALSNTTREIEKGDRWIIDSGAKCRVISNPTILIYASSCLGRKVHLPNGESTSLSYVSKCEIID